MAELHEVAMQDTPEPGLPFDPLAQDYPSRRFPVFARGGMVCSSNPLASRAGLEALQSGGTAADAVVAAAATLTVVEPTSNGVGSDAFCLYWSQRDERLIGLNSSGPAPRAASIPRVLADGRAHIEADGSARMPRWGWTPVTVPGAPGAWAALTQRFGALTLADNVERAAGYARDGYACSSDVARNWARDWQIYRDAWEQCQDTGGSAPEVFAEWRRVFAPNGRAPQPGQTVRLPDLARTLEEIGATRAESFYRGNLARAIDQDSRTHGGLLRAEDLADFTPRWATPLCLDYHGYAICELPPNGQGVATLLALNALRELGFPHLPEGADNSGLVPGRDDPALVHLQVEAMKEGFADAFAHVADPDSAPVDWDEFLSAAYGRQRAAHIGTMAADHGPGDPGASGTVYLCAADAQGNMASYIQSNYQGFGSGVVVTGTGISLQNRGADFSLDPTHPNALAPGRRTYHTIIPGFLMRTGAQPAPASGDANSSNSGAVLPSSADEKSALPGSVGDPADGLVGEPVGPFGVMGAYMQPQGHLQVVCNYVDFHLNPQQCLDAPRWQWLREGTVALEPALAQSALKGLTARGHRAFASDDVASFGRGQMIVRLEDGTLVGGTESRTDGSIACM